MTIFHNYIYNWNSSHINLKILQIGQYIRERIIPKAIWYFTNEVTDIESDMDDGESDEDYSDTSDYVSVSIVGKGFMNVSIVAMWGFP